MGEWQHQPAVAEKDPRYRLQSLGRTREVAEKGVPEEELQKDRYVPDEFDVGGGESGHEPVFRKARNPYDRPEHHGQHDPQPGHLQRVEETHQQRAAVAVDGGIGDQRLADVEGRFL